MKILLTGGGTLGPVTPLLALVETWRMSDTCPEFVWVGTPNGPERALVEEVNHISFRVIPVVKFPRAFSLQWILIPFRFLNALYLSTQILRSEKPDVIVGAGGFTQVPVIFAAALLQIPCVVLQTDVHPLLSTKFVVPFVKRIFLGWEKTRSAFPKSKTQVVGVPVRPSIVNGSCEHAASLFGFDLGKPTVLVFGGGTGALWINQQIHQILPELCQIANVLHVTGIGKKTIEPGSIPGYKAVESLQEGMADAYAIADLVVGRAGSGTISEISALSKPAILIPLPDSPQEENADAVSDAVRIVNQKETSAQMLLQEIRSLLNDTERRSLYTSRIQTVVHTNVAHQIIKEIELLRK
ncbi:MAG: UDP-N-acetylglucosamine--N-acetylmuramyl-(pentapeptide) pyrophosphoryl-undecaprenol N-acetylglucosamine transferase [Patescibacteria group bacterium]